MAIIFYDRWDVCFADVPFEEIPQSKRRPVIVLNHSTILDCLKATKSAPRANYPGEYQLKFWKEAGLKVPTVVRASKRLSLPMSAVGRKLGTLHIQDIIELEKILEILGDIITL